MDYIRTRSGLKITINPDKLHENEYEIKDIAHGLSLTNRYNGHTKYPYSVAEHSILVASLVHPEFQLEALLHDASEAYLGDMVKPFKYFLPDFTKIEYNIQTNIELSFGVHSNILSKNAVKIADEKLLHIELKRYFQAYEEDYIGLDEKYKDNLSHLNYNMPFSLCNNTAKVLFIKTYYKLIKGEYIPKPFTSVNELKEWAYLTKKSENTKVLNKTLVMKEENSQELFNDYKFEGNNIIKRNPITNQKNKQSKNLIKNKYFLHCSSLNKAAVELWSNETNRALVVHYRDEESLNHPERIKFARYFAQIAYLGASRKYSGVPYFDHLENVANIIKTEIPNIPDYVVSAAYYHDILEDTNTTPETLANISTNIILTLVSQVTRIPNRKERHISYCNKLSNASIYGKIIKLANIILTLVSQVTRIPNSNANRKERHISYCNKLSNASIYGKIIKLADIFSNLSDTIDDLNNNRIPVSEFDFINLYCSEKLDELNKLNLTGEIYNIYNGADLKEIQYKMFIYKYFTESCNIIKTIAAIIKK